MLFGRRPRADPAERGLICFDVDGTLVPGTSSSVWVATRLGGADALVAAEVAYAEGPILTTLAWTPVGGLLAGRFGLAAYCAAEPEVVDGGDRRVVVPLLEAQFSSV